MSLDLLRKTCLVPSVRLARRLRKKKLRERRIRQSSFQKSTHGCFRELVALYSTLQAFWSYQWLIFRFFAGYAETIPGVSGNEDVSTGVETDGQLKGRHIVVTRSLVPLARGPQHDVSEAVHSRGLSRELLEQAFDDGYICVQMRKLLVLFHVDCKFLPHLCLLDQFVTDPAVTVIRATVHQIMSLCRFVCEERKHNCCLPWWIVSISCLFGFNSFSVWCTTYDFMLTKLNEVLDRLKQGPSQSPQRVETSETGGDELDSSKGRQKILSKETFRLKKVYAATELDRFFVTGASDSANMPNHFYCPAFRKIVYVLTRGHHEVLRHFQGSCHFSRNQRLRLETPGWPVLVLHFHGNPFSEDELERKRGRDHEGSTCGEWPWASVRGGLDHRWSWCCWPAVANSDKGVLLGRCTEDGRQQWSCWEAVRGVCVNRRASQHWNSLDLWRRFGRFRKFPESLRLIPNLHVVLFLVNPLNWKANSNPVVRGWLG